MRELRPVPTDTVPDAPAPLRRRRRRRMQWLGIALMGYGAIGIILFVVVALAVARPLERAQQLSQSVEEQRTGLIDALVVTRTTIEGMGSGITHMDTSLGDAHAATARASTIAHGVALSMFQLRDAMSLTIFGTQPFIGLASGFDQSAQQLDLLATDLATIGASLQTNRTDVLTTAARLSELADSVAELTELVRDAPGVDISSATLNAIKLAVYAICGWLVVFAVGCVLAGLYLFRLGRAHANAG